MALVPIIMSFEVLKYFSSGKVTFSVFASLWQEDFKFRNFMGFFFRTVDPLNNKLDKKMFVVPSKNIALRLKHAFVGS